MYHTSYKLIIKGSYLFPMLLFQLKLHNVPAGLWLDYSFVIMVPVP